MSDLPLIMGIVNATGDSFSEGAQSDPASALDRALKLIDDGAGIIDIGGESTRPGADAVASAAEIGRVSKLLKELRVLRPDIPVSVDTRNAETAQAALELGAAYINDVSMLRHSSQMAAVAAKFDAYLIICHSRGTPETMRDPELCSYPGGVINEVKKELAQAAEYAVRAGVRPEKIIYDPGFGFAKNFEQQITMLREADKFNSLGAVLAGVSRKSFLGMASGEDIPARRGGATLAAELHLAGCGVKIIRTHDVKQLRDALAVRQLVG